MKAVLLDNVEKWFPFVKKCYEQDSELIEKYHTKAGFGIDACVSYTLGNIAVNSGNEIYKVYEKRDLVGYFTWDKTNKINIANSFFIVPKYRKKDKIDEFFKVAKGIHGGTFYTAISNKNETAYNYFNRNYKPVSEIADGFVVFKIT